MPTGPTSPQHPRLPLRERSATRADLVCTFSRGSASDVTNLTERELFQIAHLVGGRTAKDPEGTNATQALTGGPTFISPKPQDSCPISVMAILTRSSLRSSIISLDVSEPRPLLSLQVRSRSDARRIDQVRSLAGVGCVIL